MKNKLKKIKNKIEMEREFKKLRKEYVSDILQICGKDSIFSKEDQKKYEERRKERYHHEWELIFNKYYRESF